MGNVLYSGPYDPQATNGAPNPYQNFTVTVPSWYMGSAQLSVAHFFLLGVCSSLFIVCLAERRLLTHCERCTEVRNWSSRPPPSTSSVGPVEDAR
ncbi:hypothetical protein J3R83DRAFT_4416 [Lanmaoa asiatica]|nr:hypothetical protein J3R83DRAFT_4416 [Lanmaoa asiatica]